MVALPEPTTIDRIYAMYSARTEERRDYLGASIIGHECRRYLWLLFRWAGRPVFPGRIKRLFETGHREEDRIIENLRAIGVQVEGQQHEIVAVDGHVKGHFDGVILNLPEAPKTWHLLEIKTANAKQFAIWMREGVEKWKPTYYTQMQIYMHLGDLKRAAFIVQCKDDDQLYLERIERNTDQAKEALTKARGVIYAEEPPERIAKTPSWYQCKWCSLNRLCWENVYPDVNCRTCVHARVVPNGRECGRDLDMGDGVCSEHLYLPALLHWLEPIAGSQERIEYNDKKTGEVVINAATGNKKNNAHTSLALYKKTPPCNTPQR